METKAYTAPAIAKESAGDGGGGGGGVNGV